MSRPWLDGNANAFPVRKLAHVGSLKARIGWQNLRSDEFVDDGPYCVTGTDFVKGKIGWEGAYRVTRERYAIDKNIHLENGDLLVTKDGTIGKVAVVSDKPGEATLNSGVFLLRARGASYSSNYMKWVVQSEVFSDFVHFHSTGSTINHLYQNVFEQFRFPCPALKTQLAIASFLDREITRIDELITKKNKMANLIDERLENDIARLVVGSGLGRRDMKESGIYWCPRIPKEWQVRKGSRIGRLIGAISGEETDNPDAAVPYIKVNDLNACDAGRLVATSSWIVPNGNFAGYGKEFLVFPKRGAAIFTNKIAIAPASSALDPNVMGWRIFDGIEAEYMLWLLKVRRLDDLADVSTIPQINNKHIYPERFPMPEIGEQRAIVQNVRDARREAGRVASRIRASVDLLSELRIALITGAVTGNIEVTTWGKQSQTDRRLDQTEREVAS